MMLLTQSAKLLDLLQRVAEQHSVARSRQLLYCTLVVLQENSAHQRKNRLPSFRHHVRFDQPNPERAARDAMHARLVFANLPPQATQLLTDRFVHARRQHNQRNIRLRNPLRLLAVPEESAADQLCQVPWFQRVSWPLEFDQREAIQERHQHRQIASARLGGRKIILLQSQNGPPSQDFT